MNKEAILGEANKKAWLPRQADSVFVISLNQLEEILNPLPDDNEIAKRLWDEFLSTINPNLSDMTLNNEYIDWLNSREEQ